MKIMHPAKTTMTLLTHSVWQLQQSLEIGMLRDKRSFIRLIHLHQKVL